MACNLWKGLCATAFVSIASVVLAVGCGDPLSTPGSPSAASDEVSQALVGKQITIRGRLLLGKIGWYISGDNQQGVYLVSGGDFSWGESYSEMHGKLVTATGILRFYHRPEDAPLTDKKGRLIDRGSDFFYFEVETTRVRPIGR